MPQGTTPDPDELPIYTRDGRTITQAEFNQIEARAADMNHFRGWKNAFDSRLRHLEAMSERLDALDARLDGDLDGIRTRTTEIQDADRTASLERDQATRSLMNLRLNHGVRMRDQIREDHRTLVHHVDALSKLNESGEAAIGDLRFRAAGLATHVAAVEGRAVARLDQLEEGFGGLERLIEQRVGTHTARYSDLDQLRDRIDGMDQRIGEANGFAECDSARIDGLEADSSEGQTFLDALPEVLDIKTEVVGVPYREGWVAGRDEARSAMLAGREIVYPWHAKE